VTSYLIEVSGHSSRTYTTTATSYSITGLAAGTYYVRVRAINSAGTSGASNQATATIVAAPKAPSNLSASVRNNQHIDLAWQAPSGTVAGYRIEVSGQSNRTIDTTSTTYTVSELSAGTYYIRVRAWNSFGVSAASNQVTAVIQDASPQPPTGLRATVRSNKYVDLSWNRPSGALTSYRVEVGRSPGLTNVLARNVGTRTTDTLAGLARGTYYIRVRTVNNAVLSSPSNEVVVTTQGGAPLTPRNLIASVRANNVIELTWESQDEDATFYRVELGTSPGDTDVSSFTTGVTSSFTISELPARTYYARVRAANDDGYSEPTEDVVVSGVGGTGAPRRLAGISNRHNQVRLNWDAPEDQTGLVGYQIEAGSGPGRSDLGIGHTIARSFATGSVPTGTYFVRVRSIRTSGLGSASNELVLHVGGQQQCTAPPAAPKLDATVLGSFIQLSWAPGVGDAPTGYMLDVGSAPGKRDIISTPLAAEVHTMTAPVANGTYALHLIAVNACGSSAWGSDATLTVGGPEVTLPGAPSGLTAQVAGRSATLTWAPPVSGGNPASYVIEVLSGNGQLLLSLNTGNVSTVFEHGNVPPGRYTVRVRAANGRGTGEASNSVVVNVQ
jgi:titin